MSAVMKDYKDHAGMVVKDEAIRGWTKRVRDAREDEAAETILYDRTRRRIDIGDADEGGGGSTVLSKFSNLPD